MKNLLLMVGAAALMTACSQAGDAAESAKSAAADAAKVMQDDVGALAAAASPEVKRLIEMAKTGRYGYEITESLTTEIGPRLAGSPEEAKAREWAVAKFKELGFENVRVQNFTVPGWVRGVETAEIISPFPQPLYITSLGGSVPTPPEGIEADIAYFATFEDLQSAPMGGLEGKIVFISGLMEKHPDGAGYGPANQKRRSGATEAGKRGALAVVVRSVGTSSHRFAHTGQMRYADDVAPIPIAALSAPDADQLERTLSRGQGVRLKMVLTPQAVGELPSGNVIGEIVGSERPDEIILISGHLDSWDQGTGALDDAAGIGISAGAAKLLLDSGLKPKRTIRIVAFGAEEIGLLGGFDYVKQNRDELPKHMLATQSDFGAGYVYRRMAVLILAPCSMKACLLCAFSRTARIILTIITHQTIHSIKLILMKWLRILARSPLWRGYLRMPIRIFERNRDEKNCFSFDCGPSWRSFDACFRGRS